jgi:hypothetical protein
MPHKHTRRATFLAIAAHTKSVNDNGLTEVVTRVASSNQLVQHEIPHFGNLTSSLTHSGQELSCSGFLFLMDTFDCQSGQLDKHKVSTITY